MEYWAFFIPDAVHIGLANCISQSARSSEYTYTHKLYSLLTEQKNVCAWNFKIHRLWCLQRIGGKSKVCHA